MTPNRIKTVYVVGHTTPDTDSVCSSIAYAYFKNITDKRYLFTPVRAGKLNHETSFVLEKFGVPVSADIDSLAATVSDLELKRPIAVNVRDSIQVLALIMREQGVRSVPVEDASGRLAGVVGLKDIARHYIDSVGFADLSKAPIEIDILLKTLDGRVISNTKQITVLTGRVLIAAMQRGTILNRIRPGDVVVVGDQNDIQLELIRMECGAVIVTDNAQITNEVIAAAKMKDVMIISSPKASLCHCPAHDYVRACVLYHDNDQPDGRPLHSYHRIANKDRRVRLPFRGRRGQRQPVDWLRYAN